MTWIRRMFYAPLGKAPRVPCPTAAAYELFIVCLSYKPFSDGEINTIYDSA